MKKIILKESHYRLLFENDDLSENLPKLQSLIESGNKENIETAFQIGEGMEQWIPNFRFDNFIRQRYGELLKLVLGYAPNGNVGVWKNEEIYEYIIKGFEELFGSNYLKFKNKNLQTLPESIVLLKNAEVIDLTNNIIEKLPISMKNMKNFNVLILANNNLHKLPENLLELSNLIYLDLNNNRFETLPSEISNLVNLENLHIINNNLTNLPKEIKNLSKLQDLDIIENNISKESLQDIILNAPTDCEVYTNYGTFKNGNKI